MRKSPRKLAEAYRARLLVIFVITTAISVIIFGIYSKSGAFSANLHGDSWDAFRASERKLVLSAPRSERRAIDLGIDMVIRSGTQIYELDGLNYKEIKSLIIPEYHHEISKLSNKLDAIDKKLIRLSNDISNEVSILARHSESILRHVDQFVKNQENISARCNHPQFPQAVRESFIISNNSSSDIVLVSSLYTFFLSAQYRTQCTH